MSDRFKEKYRIPSARLQGYDYGQNGAYFITICTKNRFHYFGEIETVEMHHHTSESGAPKNVLSLGRETQNIASLQPTPIGKIAIEYWQKIPQHFPFVILDEFQIMPNHIHGIIFIGKIETIKPGGYKNKFGPQSGNLSSVLRGYKAGVKTFAITNKVEFEWQSRFHDHIIRNENELNGIRKYIIENPENWNRDRNNNEGLLM